jgi:hypothetical protein
VAGLKDLRNDAGDPLTDARNLAEAALCREHVQWFGMDAERFCCPQVGSSAERALARDFEQSAVAG